MGRYFNDELYHSSENTEEEITHYGVLGMKWGVRRYQPYSYTGGSGKEVGEAKKLSNLKKKAAKLDKKSLRLGKKAYKLGRKKRNRILYRDKTRARFMDKEDRLLNKKLKIDNKRAELKAKIDKYPDKQDKMSAKENLVSARRNLNSSLNKAEKVLTGATARKKSVIKENRKIRDEALNEINKARKILGEDEFNAILKKERFRADLIEALKTGAVTTVTGPYAAPELIRQSVSKQDRVDELAKKKKK